MNLLAIDCSASLCAACVFDTVARAERGRAVLDLGKGHAEHLMGVVGSRDGAGGRVVQPISARSPCRSVRARSPASAWRCRPRAALRWRSASRPSASARWRRLPPRRARRSGRARCWRRSISGDEHVQAAGYDALGAVWHDAVVMTVGQAAELARQSDAALAGTAARRIAEALPGWEPGDRPPRPRRPTSRPMRGLAAGKPPGGERPKPLYLREPDAKPQAGFILPRAAEGTAPDAGGKPRRRR